MSTHAQHHGSGHTRRSREAWIRGVSSHLVSPTWYHPTVGCFADSNALLTPTSTIDSWRLMVVSSCFSAFLNQHLTTWKWFGWFRRSVFVDLASWLLNHRQCSMMDNEWSMMAQNGFELQVHTCYCSLATLDRSNSPFKSIAMDTPFTAPVSLPTTSCSHECCLKTRPACAWLSSCCTWWILGPRVGNLGQPGQPPKTKKNADCR